MKRFAPFFEQKQNEVRNQRQIIQLALSEEPASVSRLAEKTGMAKDLIVWNLMGLLKWGKIVIAGEKNNELIYSLKEV
ncbi:MAG: hypothetical protein ACFFEF_06320 [Candidatus Thorarchaeota archaeon]